MENLRKEGVTVKVLDRNRKHIKKTFKMFGVLYTPEKADCTFLFFDKNVLMGCYYHKKDKTLISHKQLRAILAKEHLKEGDYVIIDVFGIGKIESINGSSFEIDDEIFHFDNFKRYANPKEIELLEGKKELEVGKWYWLNTDNVRKGSTKLLNALIYNNGKDYSYAFNWIGEFTDNFSISNNFENLIREATPQEVESALTDEAIKRGHKYEKFVYNSEENTLCGYNGRLEEVFVNGKWNEPINKFAELKEAHKNGAVIQVKGRYTGIWHDNEEPTWKETHEYRIKLEEKPKVGDVCKFWIGNEEDYFVGVLDSISGVHNDYIVRFSKTESKFCSYLKARHAKKLTKEEAIDLLFNK